MNNKKRNWSIVCIFNGIYISNNLDIVNKKIKNIKYKDKNNYIIRL